ncbi:MAG: hypothetical protein NZ891_05365 [bacterium]|nr:hypothetical protein [bacterium]MDW8164151.1 hypothetical protein [Candidatus Omnitrophota bacterium]
MIKIGIGEKTIEIKRNTLTEEAKKLINTVIQFKRNKIVNNPKHEISDVLLYLDYHMDYVKTKEYLKVLRKHFDWNILTKAEVGERQIVDIIEENGNIRGQVIFDLGKFVLVIYNKRKEVKE